MANNETFQMILEVQYRDNFNRIESYKFKIHEWNKGDCFKETLFAPKEWAAAKEWMKSHPVKTLEDVTSFKQMCKTVLGKDLAK